MNPGWRALRRTVLCTLLLVASVGCRRDAAPPVEDDPFIEFRRELAEDEALRSGRTVDVKALEARINRFAEDNADAIDRSIRLSARALPRSPLPGAPSYGRICALSDETISGFEDLATAHALRKPDAAHVVRALLGSSLPICMVEAGFTIADVGGWLGFFYMAEPTVTVCENVNDIIGVCLRYGERDVLVGRLGGGSDGRWRPLAMEWWQEAPPGSSR